LKVYIDTSFLVSLYSPDANSVLAANLMQSSKGDHLVTTFAELEFINALQLRIFRKELSHDQVKLASQIFADDLQGRLFQLVPLPEQAFDHARQLALRTTAQLGTRTADLLHVAAALEVSADYLYSFDRHQRKLAQAMRLKLN
jgi:predicted nucleic acid-binding protein